MRGKDIRGQRWLLKAENTAIKLIKEDQREGVVTIEKAQWAKAKIIEYPSDGMLEPLGII